jgi:D-xylose transport system permease protein
MNGLSLKTLKDVFAKNKILTLLFAIAVIWIAFGYYTDGDFLTARNFSNLLRQMAITGMLACGMVFVMIIGEIDLSVGSLLGLLGGIASVMDVWWGWPVWATIPVVFALGVVAGMFNGFWVAYQRVPSFIIGLAGMLAFRGMVLGITDGITVAPVSGGLVSIGQAYLPLLLGRILAVGLFVLLVVTAFRGRSNRQLHKLAVASIPVEIAKLVLFAAIIGGFVVVLDSYQGIPVPVLVLIVLLGIFTVIANSTVYGRRVYAIGGNREATRLSGVNVKRVQLVVFMVMGLMCAFAGLTTTARLAAGSPSAGNLGELDAIASCIIGGTSTRGGAGTVLGALIGALIMATLDNGMSMMGVDAFWQYIVKGGVLLLAVWIDIVSGSSSRS